MNPSARFSEGIDKITRSNRRKAEPGEEIAALVGSGVVTGRESAAQGFRTTTGIVDGEQKLLVFSRSGESSLRPFEGRAKACGGGHLLIGPTSTRNALALRETIPDLTPKPLGLATSAGFGDRLGLATRGHVRAVRATGDVVAPIFAQQSIREMERTGRSAQEVMDDATFGAISEGWFGSLGADADHLKTTEDIDYCLAAGFSFYTFDPGGYVDDRAEVAKPEELERLYRELPWSDLESDPASMLSNYTGTPLELESEPVSFDDRSFMEAAVKYGSAVAQVSRLYRHLVSVAKTGSFEVEVSVDETATPTTHPQHIFIARELKRLGVKWVSLAPRYVGEFEKGVDYIGDLDGFERDFAVHAQIARVLGPYKLSLHSGSDKFSIYEIAARETRGHIHLKTAGTSYLEALRTIAETSPEFFREIYSFSRGRYETDRASYHVSARLEAAPEASSLEDEDLPGIVDQFDAREILHVTFGSVLRGADGTVGYGDRLLSSLRAESEAYARNLESHFVRHLEPFSRNPESDRR